MYLVSPTGEEKEKQSMTRKKKKKINSAKAILLKPEASVEAIQGLRQWLPYMWDDPPGSPSTSAVSLN